MFRAKLDENNIYYGVEEVETLSDIDVEVPHDCDLKPGMYRWDVDGQTFMPLTRGSAKPVQNMPLAERALYELIKATKNPPPYCVEWAMYYEKTLDFQGSDIKR